MTPFKRFVKFTEHNDWEGESWNFWLQLDGNEQELAKLKSFLNDNDLEDNPGYMLDMTPVLENEVDILVKHSDGGYMSDHTKVEGTFTMPDMVEDEEADDDAAYEFANDNFYKGDIARHFK